MLNELKVTLSILLVARMISTPIVSVRTGLLEQEHLGKDNCN